MDEINKKQREILREKLIKTLDNNHNLIQSYLNRFYSPDAEPNINDFIQNAIRKYDRGYEEHHDSLEIFLETIKKEKEEEFLDILIYDMLEVLIPEVLHETQNMRQDI